ncbi:MAG: amidohydrolase family protein [Hyphomonadaceae bacterium]|nr:amidohydrolase family protein [Hyphomonadaceae bacterium]
MSLARAGAGYPDPTPSPSSVGKLSVTKQGRRSVKTSGNQRRYCVVCEVHVSKTEQIPGPLSASKKSGVADVRGIRLSVPHSSGQKPPQTAAPVGAVDCHHHIFDSRFHRPKQVRVPEAALDDYRLFKKRLGVSRSVFVASSNYGNDPACLLHTLEREGTDKMRGVAIVYPEVTDSELDEMHALGVRGMRVYFGKGRIPTAEEFQTLSQRAADRNWSINIVGKRNDQVLLGWEKSFRDAACPVIIDHFGWSPQPDGPSSATAQMILRLLDTGRHYIKLSGVYLSSVAGPPNYEDLKELASAFWRHAPDRTIWGSDWPHPIAMKDGIVPDGANLFDLLAHWVPDREARRKILVDNPERLYWS